MDIIVTGHGTRSAGPEQARLYLQLGFETADRTESLTRTNQLVDRMSDRLRELEARDHSPVTSSSVLPVMVRPHRPWSNTGEQLAWQFIAVAHVEVSFTEVTALAAFMEEWGLVDGVTLGSVDWTLTDGTSLALQEEALAEAVADAHLRATVVARSAGAALPQFVEVSEADAGDHVPSPLARMTSFAASGPGGQTEALELRPTDIEVSVRVRARFTASMPDAGPGPTDR